MYRLRDVTSDVITSSSPTLISPLLDVDLSLESIKCNKLQDKTIICKAVVKSASLVILALTLCRCLFSLRIRPWLTIGHLTT